MTTWVAGSLSVLIVALALLYASPRLRKAAFIWLTYLSLTLWYYFRLWEKRRAVASAGSASASASPRAKPKPKAATAATSVESSSISSSSSRRRDGADDGDVEDVVYFESAEKLLRQRELRHTSERATRLSGSSSSGNSNSGYSDDSLGRFTSSQKQPKTHLGIFRSLRKSKTDTRGERGSELSQPDTLASSSVSEPGTTTRRTYTGRKKPQSWGD